jgi:hypothetical protein
MWLANSTEEIVPLTQLQALTDALASAGIDHEVRILDGREHAGNFTADIWNDMVPWMAARLGVPAPKPVAFNEAGGGSLGRPLTIAVLVVLALTIFVVAAAYRGTRREPLPA